jgi:anhydro-N-acetylmuramic acid kinase
MSDRQINSEESSYGLFVGLMSGTSLDGVDAVLMEIEGRDLASITWKVLGFVSVPYTEEERSLIRAAIGSGTAQALTVLHGKIGRYFVRSTRLLMLHTGTDAGSLTAVGSHGQTVWHQPPRPDERGVTLQLGDAATLAEELGCAVVADFRSRDMAAGGHGAPLVPWSDWVLLSRPGVGRALQNLGGMGNVTFLPSDGVFDGVRGFDTGPGVALLDRVTQLATKGAEPWDQEGARAARGTVIPRLLSDLLDDEFLATPPPRSTGRERFGDRRVDEIMGEVGPRSEAEWNDLLATLVQLTAQSIALSYQRFLPIGAVHEVVLTGGGAHNPTLVAAIEEALAPLPVKLGAAALGIEPDAREAVAFALLAWAHQNGVCGNVPVVTGAAGRRVLGALYPGR